MDNNTIRNSKVKKPARGTRGRPRSLQTDEAILDATLTLLGEVGYTRMSLDAVAEAAGTSKPTIYLRHKNKAELAAAAIAHYREQMSPEQSGDTRGDLIRHLAAFHKGVSRPGGMAMIGTVLAEEHETPELLTAFREHVVKPRRAALRHVLERALERGELRKHADLDAAVNQLIGSYYAHYLANGTPTKKWAETTVDQALAGLMKPAATTY